MTGTAVPPQGRFAGAVAAAAARGVLVVQPRMGMPLPADMRAGLAAVRRARAATVGTITLDSYTRVGDHASARKALAEGSDLNGFPIVAHGAEETRRMIDALDDPRFAIQVRHGSPLPLGIVEALADAGLDATEGGPVSYCLPYSRTPLRDAVDAWARSCEVLAERVPGAHLESFGGCMLGQMCPPALLVAISVLEGIFFRRHGLTSVSLSYAQQTSFPQDREALAAMRRLASEYLDGVAWHVVLYTYMGVFPQTEAGAMELLRSSAVLAQVTGTERLIVKTAAEAFRIPTVADNVYALEEAAGAARGADPTTVPEADDSGLYEEARTLVESVLELDPDVGRALLKAFSRGLLDVPFCLHADNAGKSRAYVDQGGRLQWLSAGSMPVRAVAPAGAGRLTADGFLTMLSHVQRRFDGPVLERGRGRSGLTSSPSKV
ncbi:methylaspartate mutase [Streptomyces katrae]|uniref:methylaspartate mutase n=1 Tax=Streptomyces katrae TaxID=68223 RepID=UPI0006987A55|nr:methylaspartate mutase [Streptomyces katrae]